MTEAYQGSMASLNTSSASTRLNWVDHLRTFIIFLVVSIHACVTYSYIGGWYVYVPPGPSPFEQLCFILWQAHLQSFFMGLLFFLAGVFAHRMLWRRGWRGFLKERIQRLAIPSLCYMILLEPVMLFCLRETNSPDDAPASWWAYWGRYLQSGEVWSGSGPMWFAVALFGFCMILLVVMAPRSMRPTRTVQASSAPGYGAVLMLALVLAVSSFLVRLRYPLGTGVFNMQLGFFSQYTAVFTLGVLADRHQWFDALTTSPMARKAGWYGIIAGPILLVCLVAAGGAPPQEGEIVYSGGWNRWALGLALWEQSTGLALALGVLYWFRHHGNTAHPFALWLSQRSFGVYMLHTPVMLLLTPVCEPIAHISRLLAADVLTALSLVGSFALVDLCKRIPGFRKIL